MRPVDLVWNPAERRLRTPVRLLGAVAVAVALAFAGWLAAAALPLTLSVPPQVALLGRSLFDAALVGVVVAVAALALDRRRVPDYGLHLDRDWAVDFAVGLLLGAALVSLAVAVELAAGWATVAGTGRVAGPLSLPVAVLAVAGAFLAVGVGEEVAIRGYLLTNVAEALRPFGTRGAVALAVALSSATFGALHATNPNATAVGVAGIGLAGVMLGLGYVLTGDVGLPAGLHVTWNLFLGPVYGLPVSGLDVGVSLLVVRQSGPPILTGGAFGPEAGLVGVGASALGSAAVVGYARWRYGAPALDAVVIPDLRWRASTGSVERSADASAERPADAPDRRV
ncbi:MAG: lysostaphin resistance A-like protein [Haloferacaceae archaeon]